MDSKGEIGFVGHAFVPFAAVEQYAARIANGSPSSIRRSIARRIVTGIYFRGHDPGCWYAVIPASEDGPAFDAFVVDAPHDKRLPEVRGVYEPGTFAIRSTAERRDVWPYALTSTEPSTDAEGTTDPRR